MKDINIYNYKCLEKIKILNLKRVNLFTGKNNTGKSTILEALSLLVSDRNINWISYLLNSRGEINNYRDDNINEDTNIRLLATFFSNRKIGFTPSDAISIKSDKESLLLRFVKYREENVYKKEKNGEEIIIGRKRIFLNNSEDNNVLLGFEIKSENNTKFYNLDENLLKIRPRLQLRLFDSRPVRKFHLINAKGDDILNSASLWDKITLSEKEKLVIDALKIIEPKISGLSFIGRAGRSSLERYPIVKLKDTDNLYPLKAMGDGINRVLNLILALVNCDNGYLLIDEFENGLHYSVQEKLWEIIFEISNRLNIQVFVTTHSNDSINAFAKVLSKNKKYDGSLYRLERKSNEVKANLFTTEEIKDTKGIEKLFKSIPI